MAGEMTKSDLTKEDYPFHFAVAKSLGGLVKPFDLYQGPYVLLPLEGIRLWLVPAFPEDPYSTEVCWYDDSSEKTSQIFYGFCDNNRAACRAARKLLGK